MQLKVGKKYVTRDGGVMTVLSADETEYAGSYPVKDVVKWVPVCTSGGRIDCYSERDERDCGGTHTHFIKVVLQNGVLTATAEEK